MLLLATVSSLALAGEQMFAFTYGYGTVPKGGVEIEHYTTVSLDEGGKTNEWKHMVELEYGITDHLESGLYFVGAQTNAGPFAYSGFKARLKYRFGSEGVGPIDPAVYVEYISEPTFTEHGVEGKLILAKKIGGLEVDFNAEYVASFSPGGIEHEIEPFLGVGYRVAPWFAVGVESKNEVEIAGGEVEGPRLWAGPSVHLAGEGGRFWLTVSGLAPLTDETALDHGVFLRTLVAVNL